jgi:hypothetical protein
MRHRIALVLAAAAGLAAGAPVGCGLGGAPLDDGGSGPICYSDADCVPNGCCGRGTGAVHVSIGPNCSAVDCDGTCPMGMIDCGCGIPVCTDNHCQAAFTSNDHCG